MDVSAIGEKQYHGRGLHIWSMFSRQLSRRLLVLVASSCREKPPTLVLYPGKLNPSRHPETPP